MRLFVTSTMFVVLSSAAALAADHSTRHWKLRGSYASDDTWSGAYVGVSAGLVARGEIAGRDTDDSDRFKYSGINGASYGVQAGFNWKHDSFLFGASVEASRLTARKNYYFTDWVGEPSIPFLLSANLRAGYLLADTSLIYVKGGIAMSKIGFKSWDYSVVPYETDRVRDVPFFFGGHVGVGAEHKLNNRSSVFAEYNYYNFAQKYIASAEAKPMFSFSDIKVGVNYNFSN